MLKRHRDVTSGESVGADIGGSGVIEKMTLLVETLAAAGRPLRLSELSRRSGLAKTTVHRLLNRLVIHEFVHHRAAGYVLGPRLQRPEGSAQARGRAELRRIAMPYLLAMYQATGHTVLLAVLDGGQVCYLEALYGHARVPTPSARSRCAPTHATAAGKLLLAYQPGTVEQQLPASLPAYTPWTLTTKGDLAREVAGIRLRGVAYAHQEYAPGLACLAVPILGRSGQPLAALAISGPTDRFTPRAAAPHLQHTALALSRATHGLPPDTLIPPPAAHTCHTSRYQKFTPGVTSGIAAASDTAVTSPAHCRPRHQPTRLPEKFAEALRTYTAAMSTPSAQLDAGTVRAYSSRVRQFLAWLADADGDPLTEPTDRDAAVRDYHTWLLSVAQRTASTANAHLTAIDDFYRRCGLGPANTPRQKLPNTAPRALDAQTETRWLRAVERASPRDKALAHTVFYAGTRSSETVALNLDDVQTSTHKNHLIVRSGTSGKHREVPLHPRLRTALEHWQTHRATWPGAADTPALFLNHRGDRLSTRGVYNILKTIAQDAGLETGRNAEFTSHVLRHTAGHLAHSGG